MITSAEIMINYDNIYISATDFKSAIVQITLKLELYDMVDVKKQFDKAGYDLKNYLEGWFMP